MGGYTDFVTADLTCKEVEGARSTRQGVPLMSAAVLVLVRVGLGEYLGLATNSSRYLAPSLAVLPFGESAKLGKISNAVLEAARLTLVRWRHHLQWTAASLSRHTGTANQNRQSNQVPVMNFGPS
jgi:hypothetical protein